MTTREVGPTRAPSDRRVHASRSGGFSLLEVLAAVMILSIWYMIIANSAIMGLRAEGESRRRMEAGRIADQKIAEIEGLTMAGSAPEPSSDTEEIGDYELGWNIAPFTIGGGLGAQRASGEPLPEPTSLRGFVAVHTPNVGRYVRAIKVRVGWMEGETERSVTRSTFIFDQAAAITLYDDDRFATSDDDAADSDDRDDDDSNDDDTPSPSSGGGS